MGNIIELKQSDGTKAYPITLAEAVYMADGSTAENEITELKNDIDELDETVNGETETSDVTLTTGGYHKNNGTITETAITEAAAAYGTALIPVVPGDIVTISGKGASAARLYSTTDSEYNNLRVANANTDSRSDPITLTIQEGETYLCFNSSVTGTSSVGSVYLKKTSVVREGLYSYAHTNIERHTAQINGIAQEVEGLSDDVETLNQTIFSETTSSDIELTTGGYHQNNGATISQTITEAAAAYGTALIPVVPGDKFVISGKGVNAGRLYSTGDANLNNVRVAAVNLDSRSDPIELTIQEGEAWLCFNSSVTGTSSLGSVFLRKTTTIRQGLYDYAHDNIEELKARDSSLNSMHEIGDLNAYFETDIPYVVDGVKGDPSAKYTFNAVLGEEFNIRAKFRITDPIVNDAEDTYIIASVGNAVATATTHQLTQYSNGRSIGGVSRYSYYPTVIGGITYNSTAAPKVESDINIGDYAFSIKYTGNNSSASVQVTDTAIILTDSTTHTFTLANYSTMYDLFSALSALTDYEVVYNSIEGHVPSDLARFSAVNLINTCYINDVATVANAPIFVPYAVDTKWHQLEIVCINGIIYSVVDGVTAQFPAESGTGTQNIIFGGDCGVLFKDVAINTISALDAELITPVGENARIISSVNPYIIIYEGHGMETEPIGDITVDMTTSSDRIQLLAKRARQIGYVPVSVTDVIDFFDGKGALPKRCYTLIFDDYRFANFIDIKNRSAFTRNGILPALAVITNYNQTITHNGQTITIQQAVSIGKNCGFSFFSHTKDHTDLDRTVSPENLMTVLTDSIFDADDKDVNGNVIIYPSGHTNRYVMDTLRFMGFKAAINVDHATETLNGSSSKYNLTRREIGVRESLTDFLGILI